MKKIVVASCAALLIASLSSSQAQTTSEIAQWTFENIAITNYCPNPVPNVNNTVNGVSVMALGMTNWLTPAYGTNDPDILQGATGDSTATASGGDGITNTTVEWRVRAQVAGNGWSSQAPVGSQGAQFSADTTGYTNIQVTFDWYLTKQGEANLQLQYTDDNTNWNNIPITIPAGQAGKYLAFSNNTTAMYADAVQGYFVHSVAYSGGQQWFTNLTAIITDPLAANNPNFGIRLVNASTGAGCVSGAGTALNNSSGNWRFDNIGFSGAALPKPFVIWNFETLPQVVTVDPTPSLNNANGLVSAACIGMQLFGGGTTNAPDVTLGASSDTGTDGITNYTQIWRVRGASGNGWTSTAPIGSQGAQFSVDTTGYTNISVAFDWYLTKQGEANLQCEYTIDGVNWSNVPINIPAAQAGTYINFVDNTSDSDPDSVQGYYVNSVGYSNGQQWFTNLTVSITNPAAANNHNFAIRMVNASTGSSCVSGTGAPLNNSSGNWRFDNIHIAGLPSGGLLTPPTIVPSPVASVDGPFTNIFTDSVEWRTNISSISVNGSVLTNSAYVISPGQIVFTPSASTLLQAAGTITISISATNYSADVVFQTVAPGAAVKLVVPQEPHAPTGNGGTLVQQPQLALYDQYNNVATNSSGTFTATTSAGWNFGTGSAAVQPMVGGVVNFTNLSAISSGAVSGATITFTANTLTNATLPYSVTNSTAFNIPAPNTAGFIPGYLAVEQEDVASANSTFSILELSPTISNQSAPVNIYPVPATGTNALRQSSSGSTGRLALSQDGTLLCFSAALCGDSTVSDVTTVDPRGAGTFNYAGVYNVPATYVGLGDTTANQARSVTTIDNATFWMGDKGGVYTNGENPADAYIGYTVNNGVNVRSLKAYNGTVYALQQEGGTDPNASVMAIVPPPSENAQYLFELEGFPIDGSVLDFAAVASGAHGTNIDVIYYIDGTNTTSGSIFKYTNSFTTDPVTGEQIWGSTGNDWHTANGGDGLCATANASGGFDLYYTTGSGGTTGNSVIYVHDSGTWIQPINLTATNVLYTVSSKATLKGISFAPVPPAGSVPVLTPGTLGNLVYHLSSGGGGAGAGLTFNFNSTPGFSTSFSIWSATNVALPFSQWKDLGHPTESPAGTYNFTDPSATTNSAEFYRVTSP